MNTYIFILLFILTLYLTPNYILGDDNGRFYIGVLETKNNNWPKESSYIEDSTKKIVRILFYKSKKGWLSLESKIADETLYPSRVGWTIAFDGRNIGKFISKISPTRFDVAWTFPRDAHHTPLSNSLPTIGKPTEEFSGWVGFKTSRPLVTVSSTNFRDPEKWKPFFPPDSLIEKILLPYQRYLLKQNIKESIILGKIKKLKSYISNDRNCLIQIGVNKQSSKGRYIPSSTWFHLSPKGLIRNLSEIVDEKYKKDEFEEDDFSKVILVDAGDYDGNGESEIIFWVERYNRDGYVIVYDKCSAYAEFSWSYH